MPGAQREESWHLDKRIPVALVLTVLAQGAIGLWWISGLNSQVQVHERRIDKIESWNEKQSASLSAVAERLARIEQALLDIKQKIQTDPFRK